MATTKYLFFGLVVIILIAIIYWVPRNVSIQNPPTPAPQIAPTQTPKPIGVIYNCEEGKNITAYYSDESVSLILSDRRQMDLPIAQSGSGARYANKDESFVFWNKGNTAFIDEGNNTTFKGCIQQ